MEFKELIVVVIITVILKPSLNFTIMVAIVEFVMKEFNSKYCVVNLIINFNQIENQGLTEKLFNSKLK